MISTSSIVDRLDTLSEYNGSWRVLRDESALLHQRLAELAERERVSGDVLIIALVGGSGVGKSTLLNALAGDQLAKTSEFRPCTSIPTVYHPPGTRLDFETDTNSVSGAALENLVIVDTPDSDTIVKAHREAVIQVLKKCDLILMCADTEKYLDEATWSLLRPLQHERTIVCVETKASPMPSVEDHWRGRLKEEGFEAKDYFRVNSLRTFDRKLTGGEAHEDEYDFPRLERFLHTELNNEQIRRIKRSNAAGLLIKTIVTLDERVTPSAEYLATLRDAFQEADAALAEAAVSNVQRRLFSEPHLWNYALGKETSLRTKGVVGTLYKLLESIRTLPARMTQWSLWPMHSGAGHRAASLLTRPDTLEDTALSLESAELKRIFKAKESELGVLLAKAGFDTSSSDQAYDEYIDNLSGQIAEVLRGPSRDRILSRARILSSWPLALLLDIPPVAFFGFTAYKVVDEYIVGPLLDWSFFIHSGSVLAIILIAELTGISLFSRFLAWSARKGSVSDLKTAVKGHRIAFLAERESVAEASALRDDIATLLREVQPD